MTVPLPEPKFLWRRLFTFGSGAVIYGLLAVGVFKLDDEPLSKVMLGLIALRAIGDLAYMIAPTAEAIARGIAEAKRS